MEKIQTLIETLKAIKIVTENDGYYIDLEKAHIAADTALLEFINNEEVTQIYESIDKWYA